MRSRIRELDRDLAIGDVRSMNEALDLSLSMPRQMVAFVSGFAAVAAGMAVLGLAGVLAYAVSQRMREIGLRMALGARPRHVGTTVLCTAGLLVALGLGIGIGSALAGGRLLESVLFGVQPTDPAVLVAAPITLAALALLTCLIPARRAAAVEPAIALWQE